jgi:hypothetical protein
MRRWWIVIVVVWGIGLLPGGNPARAQDHALAFFTPAHGVLNDEAISEDWTFEGRADEVISLVVVTLRGDLDPTLQLIAPEGQTVAENDDLDSLVRDAGLEALVLPADGSYTVRIARYQGQDGTTTGEYELTLTPGFAKVALREGFDQGALSWLTPTGEQLPLAQERLRLRAVAPDATLLAFPPDPAAFDELYYQATAQLFGTSSYAEAGLVFRAGLPGLTRSYQFKVNTRGQWRVLMVDETGVFALRTWSSDVSLSQASGEWTLAVLARANEFSFYANGILLGTLSDDRLPLAGAVGVLAGSAADQTDLPTILFDDVIVTTRLGTTYRGLPLALATWESSDPGAIARELADSGMVTLADARDLFLPEKTLTANDITTTLELIGSDQALYADFVLSADLTIMTAGQSNGCGLFYRWQDDRDFDLSYIDTAGGFGVVQSRDGDLTKNVYALSPMVQAAGANKLLVVAQGDHVALYVNGALVTEETVLTGTGRAGVALLNYEDVRTDCLLSNIWVWPLE